MARQVCEYFLDLLQLTFSALASITVNYRWLHAIGVALADYMPIAFYSVERKRISAKCSDEFLHFTSIMILIRCFPIGICLPEMFYLAFLLF